MDLQLKKFDMKKIKDDEIVVLIGKRNTGKSFLTKDFLYHHKDIPIGTVISPTESANKFYGHMIPPILIHEKYDIEITKNFMKRQKKTKKEMKKGSNMDNRAFLILDDCLYDNSWKNDENIREIFMNGRHWGIMFILIMQYALGIPPVLRSNIDYVFILRENIYSNRKKLYEHYAGMFPTFDMFNTTMDQCTENYECLVIHCSAKSNKLEDQVFWYKADNHNEFKICNNDIWNYSKENYVEYDLDEDEIKKYLKSKKKGPDLQIKKTDQ